MSAFPFLCTSEHRECLILHGAQDKDSKKETTGRHYLCPVLSPFSSSTLSTEYVTSCAVRRRRIIETKVKVIIILSSRLSTEYAHILHLVNRRMVEIKTLKVVIIYDPTIRYFPL
jgi:hypothetical protein